MIPLAACLLLAQAVAPATTAVAAADERFAFRKQADPAAGSFPAWKLWRGQQRVDILEPGKDVVLVREGGAPGSGSAPILALDLFGPEGNWRAPAVRARRSGPESTARQVYLNFLKQRYGYQIGALNRAYGMDASAFTELESEDFSRVKPALLLADDELFASEWMEERVQAHREKARGSALFLLVLPSTARLPASLVAKAADLVDGFLTGDPRGTEVLPRPTVRLSRDCRSTAHPVWIAACLRISDP